MYKEIVDIILDLFPDLENLKPDTSLFASKRLDSFAVIEIIAELERKFHIQIDVSETEIEQLDSIEKIEILVGRLKR